MATVLEVKYFNSFWLKKVVDQNEFRSDATQNPAFNEAIYPGSNPSGYNLRPQPVAWATYQGQAIVNQEDRNWEVEEARIRGGYNNTSVDFGVKAFVKQEEIVNTHRPSSMIYSGIFNSRTGINQTNQFPIGQDITKTADPHNGSIQKLFAEDNDLTVFQENKVSRALIDKDAIYSAEGQGTVTSTQLVIGQIVPYVGNYGISDNPESFAFYGYRKYFTDKYRGVVLRLSRDGITEISAYGMFDWFRDYLAAIPNSNTVYSQTASISGNFTGLSTAFVVGSNADGCPYTGEVPKLGSLVSINGAIQPGAYVIKAGRWNLLPAGQNTIVEVNIPVQFGAITPECKEVRFDTLSRPRLPGGWDIHNKQYTVSLQNQSNYFPYPYPGGGNPISIYGQPTSVVGYSTLVFDDGINGWVSFYSYNPTFMGSVKDKYYSFNSGKLWEHYYDSRNRFGEFEGYQTFYGWESESSITFIFNPQPSIMKNFLTLSYEGSNGWYGAVMQSGDQGYQGDYDPVGWKLYNDETLVIPSVMVGESFESQYDANGNIISSVNPTYRGFTLKENRYVANLINNSQIMPQEVIYGPGGVINNKTSGIKGYFTTVKIATDIRTYAGGPKELYSVGSIYQPSSY